MKVDEVAAETVDCCIVHLGHDHWLVKSNGKTPLIAANVTPIIDL
jgi:hypothetical protein